MGPISAHRLKLLALVVFSIVLYVTYRIYAASEYNVDKSKVAVQPLRVTVYYESLCPDSKHFFVNHLQAAHERLNDNLSVELIPYGKAKTFTSPEGDLDFQCQHGETECYGNKIHACVIEKIGDVHNRISMITCMIKDNSDPEAALRRCISTYDPDPILECSKSPVGAELLKRHGLRTSAVRPSFIPTIHVGDARGDQPKLLKNLMLELCTYYPDDEKPSACL